MVVVECKRCGSNELRQEVGVVVCVFCRTRYASDQKMAPSGKPKISISDDIADLLQKCQDDPINRRRYAGLILDLDPTNQDAIKYL